MPREVVSLHVGQCGLQLGMSFWQQAAQEHRLGTPTAGSCDDAASTFFYSPASSPSAVQSRCVLVDTEPRVLSTIARSSLFSSLLDSSCTVSDISGAGNNFAVGWLRYGPQYAAELAQAVRRQAERCESLQAFLLSHSTGGGTGSGLGSFLLTQLKDDYPDCSVIDLCVLPSEQEEHVVTAPYNAALSLQRVAAAADLVLPVDNAALTSIAQQQQQPAPQHARVSAVPPSATNRAMGGGFAPLNGVCAAVLCSLTAGLRFGGELNLDLTDLTQTLCPFPSTNLLIPSMTPLQPIVRHYSGSSGSSSRGAAASSFPSRPPLSSAPALSVSSCYFHTLSRAAALQAKSAAALSDSSVLPLDGGGSSRSRTESQQEDALFQSLLQPQHRLLQADTSSASFLSCALLARGELSFGSLQRQVALLSRQMHFVPLCSPAVASSAALAAAGSGSWKLSLCSTPNAWSACSVLALSNSSAMAARVQSLISSCEALFRRRAHWHHYAECGLEEADMQQSLHDLRDLCAQYTACQ